MSSLALQQKDEVVRPHYEVKRENVILQAYLLRGWQDDGEHSKEYCVELQFKNKKIAETWLKRHRIQYTEIADHEPLPFIPVPEPSNES